MTKRSISKLCEVGVLLTTSVLASPTTDGVALHPPAANPAAARVEALENCTLVWLKRVHFSADQSDLSRREKATLGRIAKTLSERTASIIELRGYADGASSTEANIALSVGRANAIAQFLIERHVARERILILGLGEVDPTGPTSQPDNQRVDLRVFAPPMAETSVRHESVEEAFITYTWGAGIEP